MTLLWSSIVAEHPVQIPETTSEAVREIQQFFRVYHSLRIVKDSMVIRIHQQLSQVEVTQLNQEFSVRLTDGQFQ